ncbi:hypothetical protein GQ599_10090, partial [Streptococcus thermophilus]|nr:hypothetical protein [Streptococcus thermophilus]
SIQCPELPGEVFPNPSNCSNFCECVDEGVALQMPCPGGLLFDATLYICNFPDQVDCGNRPSP